MNNYYEFTKLYEDRETIDIYSSLSNNELKNTLDNTFNDIDEWLSYFANVFKETFKGSDYDEHFYHAKVLLEELNNIKIILNILEDRNKDE